MERFYCTVETQRVENQRVKAAWSEPGSEDFFLKYSLNKLFPFILLTVLVSGQIVNGLYCELMNSVEKDADLDVEL